jgi:RNA polymerase sigma-70 factor (ECF subfamily)
MFGDTQILIERCIRREEKAWEEFVERFSGLLHYSARERLMRSNIMFNQQDVEDIVQAVFMEIWERSRLKEVQDRKKIKAWLSIMAQTRALNYMRKKKERLLPKEELFRLEAIEANAAAYNERLSEELESVLEDFEPRQRLMLRLNIIYEKGHREIAEFMNIPINTVSTIIARKKKILQERLKKDERR